MAGGPKLGSPPGSTLLAVWSAGKTVDWCRYFQSFYTAVLPTQCSGVHVSNVILSNSTLVLPLSVHGFFCIPHNVVQTQFTFVKCGIKRSSHAFCARPAKLAQSLYCRCVPPTKSIITTTKAVFFQCPQDHPQG